MNQLLARLALALLVGLALTIAVAWALAALVPHHGLTRRFNTIRPVYDDRTAMVWVTEYSRTGMIRREWSLTAGMPPSGTIGALAKGLAGTAKADTRASYRWGHLERAVRDNPPLKATAVEDARGWPVPAFWCEVSPAAMNGESPRRVGGFALPAWWGALAPESIRILPFRPIWRGLATDMLFWSAVWIIGGTATRAGVRQIRLRRGRCPACAYDLKRNMTVGCPECGWNRPAVAVP